MRYAVRRLLILPLMLVLAAVVFVLLPVVGVVQAIAALGVVAGRRSRWRALRLWVFAAVYCAGECLCVLACLLLWLASPVPRWRDGDRWQARHVQVLSWYLGMLMHTAGRVIAFRLTLECPRGASIAPDRPVIVLGRHAGPGASLVLIRVLLRDRGRVPKIVLKEKLRLDPALDVLLTRIGCAFIGAGGAAGAAVTAVAGLASQLTSRDALVLFPEGSDWTPTRHWRAVRRLRRKGMSAQADAVAEMPNVLPPRPAGTFAALQAAPAAELAVFMHTGHDELLDAASIWRALPLRRELHMVWWNEPRPELASEQECSRWLNQTWVNIDAWIQEQGDMAKVTQQGKPPPPRSQRPGGE
jgi:1-acyl-sn-glycerol-3-phosphate acyltransferase